MVFNVRGGNTGGWELESVDDGLSSEHDPRHALFIVDNFLGRRCNDWESDEVCGGVLSECSEGSFRGENIAGDRRDHSQQLVWVFGEGAGCGAHFAEET